ncbi:polyphosphate kinase 2 [Leptothrix discophora]|uniref:ADP/GDP-polyphosphate phosphotransferase n=1 Tax=Leptothrix discophora TaxID=89 RepID=A0ABT9G7G3_LEPDI|nr:polyphosphate kinase 2 [Leptothrix discophora]MDP4302370.1 polyphosphate kinase 2 [Leptothrix discophora]
MTRKKTASSDGQAVRKQVRKAAKPGMGKAAYLEALKPMQERLNDAARWLAHTGRRLVVVLEGRDTAGKGGAAYAISETLNPRQCDVVALGRPSDRERSQWYFQRYVPHLPAAGEIAIFDRSWYNRAGVERVMGFCSEQEAKVFLRQVPDFERLLVDDGILLFKYWLCVDQAQQEARFADRLTDPLKRWKLSQIDVQARERYAEYTRARNDMLKATDTPHAPWTLVDFNDQRIGRLTLVNHLLSHLPIEPVPQTDIVFAPLRETPLKESYGRGHAPIEAHRP